MAFRGIGVWQVLEGEKERRGVSEDSGVPAVVWM